MKNIKKETQEIRVPALRLSKAKIPINGISPLLMDKMPQETLKAIEDKQSGKVKSGKKLRNIDKEIESAIHYLPDRTIGFPAQGFMAGLIESTSFIGDKFFSKKLVRGIKIMNTINGLVPIKFKKRDVLTHNVGSNTKHTPQFHDWETELVIQFDANNISETDIATLISYAGFYYGIGIWSPRCKSGGSFGMYQLKTKK